MGNIVTEDALRGQQSRIMSAMRAAMQPQDQAPNPQDLLQALTAQGSGQGNYFDMMKQSQATQAQNNIAQETGIYNQMKEQVARGNTDAATIDKAITDIAGDDPKIYSSIAEQLHSDPEPVTPANAKAKVIKYASEMGINPLSNQEAKAKVALLGAQAAKAQGEANQMNIFNPANNITPTTGIPITSQSNTQSTSGANEGYLAQLPTPVATQVKALAEGRMQFPSGFALKSPYWQQMLQAVSTYDPSFDSANYNARATTRKDFTSGKSAQNITALNTAIGHLDALNKAFTSLDNGDYPAYNAIANKLGTAFGNKKLQSATTDVNTKAIAVAGELAKVFRSTGMSTHEIDDWKNQMSTATTPTQAKTLINGAIDLMNSRLDAIGQQYSQGMGTTKDPIQLLSPKAQKILTKLEGNTSPESIKVTSEPISQNDTPEMAQQRTLRNKGKVVDYTEYFK